MEVRKQWILVFITLLLFGFVNTASSASAQHWPKTVLAITLGGTWLYNGLLFYCAYWKGGTKLLTFSLIGLSLSLLSEIVLVGCAAFKIALPLPLQAAGDTLIQQPLWNAIGFVIMAFYFYASIRLRSFNRRALKS